MPVIVHVPLHIERNKVPDITLDGEKVGVVTLKVLALKVPLDNEILTISVKLSDKV